MNTIDMDRWHMTRSRRDIAIGVHVSAVSERGVEDKGVRAVAPLGIPASVPKSQIYLWSAAWQENEVIADQEIAEGDVVTFEDPDNATDVVHWLLNDDD